MLGLQTITHVTREHRRQTQPTERTVPRELGGDNADPKACQGARNERRAEGDAEHRIPHGVLGLNHVQAA